MSERHRRLAFFLSAVLASAACAHRGQPPATPAFTDHGLASWYGEPYHGRRTASGEVYDMHDRTAAHRSLDFGTWVRVTRTDTGAAVEVRVNDRGPFVAGRVIDLSYAAARAIGLDLDGVAPVRIAVLDRPGSVPPAPSGPPPPAVGDCLWVQVGAFAARDNAERAAALLRAEGEKVVVMAGPEGLERVRVGPFTTRAAAEAAVARLRPDWPPARVVECGG
jgi:rare lipoprotein A